MFHSPEFWVAVAFFILLGLIARPAVRQVTGALDSRAERIRAALDDAAGLREEAHRLLAEYQRKQRDAAKEIDQLVASAEAEAARLSEEALQKLEEAVRRREQLALDKIAQAEADALQQVRNTAVDLSIAATRRLIADRLDQQEAARLIDSAIAELPSRMH